ncbi:RNA-binding protein 39, partial [Cucurbita argyrosperma subsp. argyrosperma]
MDFDEYDYLEKAVEDQDDKETKKAKKSESERNEKSSRKREVDEEAGSGGRVDEELKVKRSKSEHENGKEDRDHSGRARDRHRRDREEETDGVKERDRERNRTRDRGSSEKERDRDRDREERHKEKEKERERDKGRRDKERDRERHKEKDRERDKDRRDKEREREKEKERERREREKREREREEERSRRSRSRSVREKEREVDVRENRRMKEKKDMVEPEADPERDQRTVFAYQMPLKATERDVYEFFSKAGKVRDVRLIMDRNSRRSKGVGNAIMMRDGGNTMQSCLINSCCLFKVDNINLRYVEFYDAMSVPMAIALSGQLLFGQPVMVKPSEAEKNLVQSNTSGASGAGPYGAVDRKLYVGNLHFNMTETHLREIFEAFGPVELVQLPLDLESGHCKGFGFVQFAHLEHAKAAQSLNGKLEIAGRTIKVSSVTDHIGAQENVAKSNDLDDDEGGGLALNAQSRALLMQKLDRTGIATSIAGSLGAPVLNASAPNQRATSLPLNGQAAVAAPVLPANFTPPVLQSVGSPSECLLLKNMFDPSTETAPDFDLEIKEDVEEECSKYGHVKHIYVDKNSAGCVYLQYDTVEAAINAQRAMHLRWFAGRQISVLFMLLLNIISSVMQQPQVYEAKFIGA